jgi:hypothetical protein
MRAGDQAGGNFYWFSSRVDGSLSFRGSTPELTVPEKVAMMSLQGLLTEVLIYPKEEERGRGRGHHGPGASHSQSAHEGLHLVDLAK